MSKSEKSTIRYTEPIFLRKLVEAAGGQKAAGDFIGLSGSHISYALSGNEQWRYTHELAAKLIYEEKFGTKKTKAERAGVFSIAGEHTATITMLIENLGGKVHVLS